MAFDYSTQGYKEPIIVWRGILNNNPVAVHVWIKKRSIANKEAYAIDIRNVSTNETIKLEPMQLNWLMAKILYETSKHGEIGLIVPKKNRFETIIEDMDDS